MKDHDTLPPDDAGPEGAPSGAARVRRRWRRRLGFAVAGAGLALVAAALVLANTRVGQRALLKVVVERVRNVWAGEVTIRDIHSGGVLGGATLVGVRLTTGDGRPFLEMDSVAVRYSAMGLLRGLPRVSSVHLWGPRVEVSRYTPDQDMNVAHLLRPSPPASDSARPVTAVEIGRLEIHGGLVEILTPLEGRTPSAPRVPAPGGEGGLERLALEDLKLEVDDALLLLGSPDPLSGFLVNLQTRVVLFDEPITIAGAEGHLRFGTAGIHVEDGFVRLPGTVLAGDVTVGPTPASGGGWTFAADLTTEGTGSLADLRWLDPRLPDGSLSGGVKISAGPRLEVTLRDVRAEAEADAVSAQGRLTVDEEVTFSGMSVTARPLSLSRLAEWIPEAWLPGGFPLDGFVSGTVTLDGPVASLGVHGTATMVPEGFGGTPTTARVEGGLHPGDDPGVTNLSLVLDPFNFQLLDAVWPHRVLPARGRVALQASGRVREGVRFAADVRHEPEGLGGQVGLGEAGDLGEPPGPGEPATTLPAPSRAVARGIVRRDTTAAWVIDAQGDLAPLSLGILDPLFPKLGLQGTAQGWVRVVAMGDSLDLSGDVSAGEGRSTFHAARVGRGAEGRVRLDVSGDDFPLSELSSRLPAPSRWTGRATAEWRGARADSLEGGGLVQGRASRIGGLHLDSIAVAFNAGEGLLRVDSARLTAGGVRVEGSGALGLGKSRRGSASFSYRTESLLGLRPLLLSDTVLARDTLSVLDRQLLRLQGVDPDTLPLLEEVAMSGALRGVLTLSGNLDSLDVETTATLRAARYGTSRVDTARVRVGLRGLPSPHAVVDLEAAARGVEILGRGFRAFEGALSMADGAGTASLSMERRAGERYRAEGDFALDSLGGEAFIREARVELDTLAWENTVPTYVTWSPTSVEVDTVLIRRAGDDPMTLAASGRLDREGDSDFSLAVEAVHLDRMARLLQWEEGSLAGRADLDVRVTGPAVAPELHGAARVLEPGFSGAEVDSAAAELSYRLEEAEISFQAWEGDGEVLRVAGSVPVDLSLDTAQRHHPSREMDVEVVARALPASVIITPLEFLEDVRGTVTGTFHVAGTVEAPEPSGTLTLDGGAWTVEALGVRQHDAAGTVVLNPDRRVDVNLRGKAGGTARVSGIVTLEPLRDPRLDLDITFNGFQALERRDVEGRISGTVNLVGSYRRPLMEGDLTVDRGTLFLEEFQRSVEVVDLTDPRIFEVVDTTVLSARPLIREIRNPFLDSLRVNVNLAVPRDTWLRSSDMNVEIGGDLIVVYDRAARDLVMVGELQALRGTYVVLGRTFEVQGGTVGFVGTPGINPTLNIQAVSRIRRVNGEPLNVIASVEGTLTQPRVTLSSDEPGLAESDLVSYLIFGRPSYELATGQAAFLRGAAGSFVSAAATGGVTWAAGTVATRLGAAVAQQIGVDYLSISQAGDFTMVSGTLSESFAATQIEVGQYLGEDVFFVLIFRPLARQGSSGVFGGARVEWALNDLYTFEGFVEDRFLRSGIRGFGDLGFQTSRVLGVFIFREWGY
ncbi:MAG: translocation/assembly module TamB domain-containing protein [Gemmatimonadota bacterium]